MTAIKHTECTTAVLISFLLLLSMSSLRLEGAKSFYLCLEGLIIIPTSASFYFEIFVTDARAVGAAGTRGGHVAFVVFQYEFCTYPVV